VKLLVPAASCKARAGVAVNGGQALFTGDFSFELVEWRQDFLDGRLKQGQLLFYYLPDFV